MSTNYVTAEAKAVLERRAELEHAAGGWSGVVAGLLNSVERVRCDAAELPDDAAGWREALRGLYRDLLALTDAIGLICGPYERFPRVESVTDTGARYSALRAERATYAPLANGHGFEGAPLAILGQGEHARTINP